MSKWDYVFAEADVGADEFFEEIGAILDSIPYLDLTHKREGNDFIKFGDEDTYSEASANHKLDDEDLRFENYRFKFSVERRDFSAEERLQRQRDIERTVFERLRCTGRYHLLLTYNLHEKMDEFHPTAQ